MSDNLVGKAFKIYKSRDKDLIAEVKSGKIGLPKAAKSLGKSVEPGSTKPKKLAPGLAKINNEMGSNFKTFDELIEQMKSGAVTTKTPPPDNSVDMKQIGELADHTVDELREIYKYHKKKFGKVPDLKSIKGVIEFALFAKTRA